MLAFIYVNYVNYVQERQFNLSYWTQQWKTATKIHSTASWFVFGKYK